MIITTEALAFATQNGIVLVAINAGDGEESTWPVPMVELWEEDYVADGYSFHGGYEELGAVLLSEARDIELLPGDTSQIGWFQVGVQEVAGAAYVYTGGVGFE